MANETESGAATEVENQQRSVRVRRGDADSNDLVAVEAALELRLGGRPLAVTLRTPGAEVELGLGFLLAEGIIERRSDVAGWRFEREKDGERGEVLDFDLIESALDRWARRRVEREFRSNSACGACGKPRLEDLFIEPLRADRAGRGAPTEDRDADPQSAAFAIDELPSWIERARSRQDLFAQTGGVHAAAEFDSEGRCHAVFEDVGRHNALDKLVGAALLEQRASGAILDDRLVLSTGRAGFEIVQKSLRARAVALATIGAATSMAVDLACDAGMPLIAFAGSASPVRYLAPS